MFDIEYEEIVVDGACKAFFPLELVTKCSARSHVMDGTGRKTERYQSVQNSTGGIKCPGVLLSGNLRGYPLGVIQCLIAPSRRILVGRIPGRSTLHGESCRLRHVRYVVTVCASYSWCLVPTPFLWPTIISDNQMTMNLPRTQSLMASFASVVDVITQRFCCRPISLIEVPSSTPDLQDTHDSVNEQEQCSLA